MMNQSLKVTDTHAFYYFVITLKKLGVAGNEHVEIAAYEYANSVDRFMRWMRNE